LARRAAPNSTRIAVSGGAGFIGSHTVELLVAAGAAVLVIDDHTHACGQTPPAEVEVVRADCGSLTAARALKAFRPDVALHLASKGGVQKAARNPGEHVKRSVASSVAFFDAAIRAGAGRILTASSGGTIYGQDAKLPAREVHKAAPVSAYGAGKRSEEVYLAALGLRHGVATLAMRYGNVYGPRQDGTGEAGVVAITCYRLLDGTAPVVYGDGGQTRDFVYVGDVAAANVAGIFGTLRGAVNIGTGRETSINTIVKHLLKESGLRTATEFLPAREFEVRNVRLECTRAQRQLRWKSKVSINAGLAATWSWFCNRQQGAGYRR